MGFNDLKPHPFANMFPYIQGEELAEFVEDIRTNGLQEQIILFDGQILDGRNRYNALKEIGDYGKKHFISFEVHCTQAKIQPDPLCNLSCRRTCIGGI